MSAERIVSTSKVASAIPGIEYDMTTTQVVDACSDCGGDGVIRFSTFADYRAFIHERNWREENDDPDERDDYYHTPARSGSKSCERCSGTGTFVGDGGCYTMKLTYFGNILFP